MATPNIVPRAAGEGGLGTAAKGWGGAFVTNTTTSSATQGGKLALAADDGAVMADNHRLGVIEFKGAEDTSNTLSIGARIQSIARDAWDGSNNDADLEFYTTNGTTESKVLTLDADKKAAFAGSIRGLETQFTYHNFSDDIDTTKHYISLVEVDAEDSSATTGIKLPFIAPLAGKLLRIYFRCNKNLTGHTITWRLETQGSAVTFGTGPSVVGTQSGAGPNTSGMTTYDFTTGLDSGDNIVDAGDMVYLSMQSNTDLGSSTKHYITCLWEWDTTSIG